MPMNSIQEAIFHSVVKPMIDAKTFDAEGLVVGANYYAQTIDVEWQEWNTGAKKITKGLHIPKEADGVHKTAVQIGDRVRLSFKGADHRQAYVSMLYNHRSSMSDFFSRSGTSVPRGMNHW